jgi:hypothetical protein
MRLFGINDHILSRLIFEEINVEAIDSFANVFLTPDNYDHFICLFLFLLLSLIPSSPYYIVKD